MIPVNPSKQFISSHGLVSGALRAALFLGLMGFAFHARADNGAADTTSFTSGADVAPLPICVFSDLKAGEECPAYSTARALEFLGMGEEAIIFVEKDAPISTAAMKDAKTAPVGDGTVGGQRERTSVLASSRIEDSVLLEQIDEDDAMLLEREVQELSGARYELPKTRSEVKKLVGFPESAEVASEDWIEMIRVHAEMTLSLSKNASRFLLEQMGLASSRAAATAAAATVLPDASESHPAVIETH
jgi:hypothetical protein